MLKSMIWNILLKRGASALEEAIGKAIRHGMTTYGGILLHQGLTDAQGVTAMTGGAVAVAGVLLSLVRIYIHKKFG